MFLNVSIVSSFLSVWDPDKIINTKPGYNIGSLNLDK